MNEEFLQHLRVITLKYSPEAEAAIISFRNNNINEFIEQIIYILQSNNENISDQVKALSLILTYQAFPEPETESFSDNFYNRINEDLYKTLLSISSYLFSSNIDYIRTSAATLFSRIAVFDILTYDKLGIIPTLINELTNPTSLLALHSICLALTDIFEACQVDDQELATILTALFKYLSDENLDDELKNACIKVLRTVIDNMAEVLSDEENANSLFTALFALSENSGTKAEAFKCWTQFVLIYYPMLEVVMEQLVNRSFTELINLENDRDTLISVCEFWLAIAECEMNKNANLQIISRTAESLIPFLFRISANIPFDECDSSETYEPHVVAAQALQAIVACAPTLLPILLNFLEFANSEHFGEREAALNILNYIIQFCDPSSILIESLNLIGKKLGDSSPRVRQTAVYCVHAVLNSILTKKNSCPFAPLIPRIGKTILQLSVIVIQLMKDEAQIAATASSTTADFIQFPGFPYVGSALGNLLSATLRNDIFISQSAFSALQNAIRNASNTILHQLMLSIFNIINSLLSSNSDFWIINHFLELLQSIFIKLSGQINNEVDFCWKCIEMIYRKYENEVTCLLAPISSLARATGDSFLPYLPYALEMLLNGLKTFDREDSIPSASFGISLISDKFDLSKYAPELIEALINAITNQDVSIESKKFVVEAIGSLTKSAPHVFIQYSNKIIPPILEICSQMNDILESIPEDDEDFNVESLLITFCTCMQNALKLLLKEEADQSLSQTVATGLLDLLEIIGGLKEHSDNILTNAILSMFILVQSYPQHMKEYFDDEPGYEVLIREAIEAQILPEVTNILIHYLSN